MEVIPKYSINRWDKDSIRPGPVGTVGDVNVQVMLKKSSPDMPNRFDPTFSGKNAAWSGSNVSDGSWYGWTSGGRGAVVISKALPNNQTGGKIGVGWRMQNIVAADRSRETKVTPLGRYGWDTTVGSILKAKVSGDLFLPLPEGYKMYGPPRGTQYPRIIETSIGTGVALPPADIPITDPTFGDTGKIEIPQPGNVTCEKLIPNVNWAPALDDQLRITPPPETYRYRKAWVFGSQNKYDPSKYPDLGKDVLVFDLFDDTIERHDFDPCGEIGHPAPDELPPPITVPKPGNQDKRRQDKKKEREEERKKKQKLR